MIMMNAIDRLSRRCAFGCLGLEELRPRRVVDEMGGLLDRPQDWLDGVDHVFGDELEPASFLDAIKKLGDGVEELGAETPEVFGVAYFNVIKLDTLETRFQDFTQIEALAATED